MLDADYLSALPRNRVLAADRLCADYFAGSLRAPAIEVLHILEALLDMGATRALRPGPFGAARLAVDYTWWDRRRPASARIRKIHRHVKALIARRVVDGQAADGRIAVPLGADEVRRIGTLLTEAREAIRACHALEPARAQALRDAIARLGWEIDRSPSDYRAFLDAFATAAEALAETGPPARPVYAALAEIFALADTRRAAAPSPGPAGGDAASPRSPDRPATGPH